MLFTEKQQLNLWWLYLILGAEAVIMGTIFVYEQKGLTFEALANIYFIPVWAILLPFAIIFVVNKSVFRFEIDENGIRYRYFPFVRRKSISWDEVLVVYLRKYDALGEYGGWGVKTRLWFKLKDKAFIFNDQNIGLQFELVKRKKLLFSTSKREELQLFLLNLKQKHQISAIDPDVRER